LSLGAYYEPNSSLEVILAGTEVGDDDSSHTYGLRWKTVQTNDEGVGYSTTFNGSRETGGDNNGDILAIDSTYYFSRTLGWGVSYAKLETDLEGNGKSYSTSIENFFTSEASVKAAYIIEDFDDEEAFDKERVFELSVRIRM